MNYQQSHNPIKYEPQNNSILEDKLMTHEGQLGYIQGKMESFATKADIKDLEGKIALIEERLQTKIKDEINKQTKWIIVGIWVPFILAVLGWMITH